MAAGNVAADGFDRNDALADSDAGFDFERPRAGKLLFGDETDIPCGVANRAEKIRADVAFGCTDFFLRKPKIFRAQFSVIEFICPCEECGFATAPDVRHDFRSYTVRLGVGLCATREKVFFQLRCELSDAHQSTILFKGYSTMP